MSQHDAQKNGNLTIERGGVDRWGRQRSMKRTAHEVELMDKIQQRFLTLTTERGPISRAIKQCADGEQKPCQSIARRILELRAAGFTAEEREEITLGEVRRWNRDLDSQRKPAA